MSFRLLGPGTVRTHEIERLTERGQCSFCSRQTPYPAAEERATPWLRARGDARRAAEPRRSDRLAPAPRQGNTATGLFLVVSRHNAPSAWSTSTGCCSSSRCMTGMISERQIRCLVVCCYTSTSTFDEPILTWSRAPEGMERCQQQLTNVPSSLPSTTSMYGARSCRR